MRSGPIRSLPDGEEIMPLAFFVLTQYRRVTDRQTDGHVAIAITRASIASRGFVSDSWAFLLVSLVIEFDIV